MLQPVITTLSSKGQVVIPSDFRKFLGLKPKMAVLIWPKLDEKKVMIEPFLEDPIEAGFGLLKDWRKSATEIMRETRKEERKYEEKKVKKIGFG